MRFHLPKTSFLSTCQPLPSNAAKKIKLKNNSSGLKINSTQGSGFRTLKREGAFWSSSEKLLEKPFTSPSPRYDWPHPYELTESDRFVYAYPHAI